MVIRIFDEHFRVHFLLTRRFMLAPREFRDVERFIWSGRKSSTALDLVIILDSKFPFKFATEIRIEDIQFATTVFFFCFSILKSSKDAL